MHDHSSFLSWGNKGAAKEGCVRHVQNEEPVRYPVTWKSLTTVRQEEWDTSTYRHDHEEIGSLVRQYSKGRGACAKETAVARP